MAPCYVPTGGLVVAAVPQKGEWIDRLGSKRVGTAPVCLALAAWVIVTGC